MIAHPLSSNLTGRRARVVPAAVWLLVLGLLTAVTLSAQPAPADAAAQNEARLREALRTTTLQLRTAQNDLAALQLVQTEKDKELESLRKQVAALTKRGADDRAEAGKAIAALNTRITEKDERIGRLTETGNQWKAAAEKTDALAKKLDAERERLAVANAELERRAADREAKNVALVRVAHEILARFERFGIGDAITAREPFIRTKRVQLQNLLQTYADRIDDHKAGAGQP